MKFQEIIKKYQCDIFLFSSLLIIFGILAFVFVGHQGNPIIDCGREAYIPSAILKGKVLYKDIFILYGPFSYQLNALLYRSFGEHLNTLYTAGIVNSLIILTSIYLIARTITSNWVSWITSLTIMVLFIFHYFHTNYIFPYCYAITYALNTFLLALLFCIYYFKTYNPKLIPISFFFISISILSKIEYSLFLIVLGIILFIKPIAKKYVILSLFSFLIIPIISWSILLIQGLDLSDITTYINTMYNYSKSKSLEYFYKTQTGFFPTSKSLTTSKDFFISALMGFIKLAVVIYPVLFVSYKLKLFSYINKAFQKIKTIFWIIFPIIIGISIIPAASFLSAKDLWANNPKILEFILKTTNESIISWLPLSATGILIILIVRQIINCRREYNNPDFQQQDRSDNKFFKHIIILKKSFNSFDLKDKIFIFLAFIGIIITLKTYFCVDLHVFGTFILPLVLMINIVFLIDKIPDYFKFIDKKIWKSTCIIILIIFNIAFFLRFQFVSRSLMVYPIKENKGTLYSAKEINYAVNETIKYINNNIPQDAKVLMIPEGVIVNFFTDRPSDERYYSLIPNYVETFGEDNVVENLRKNPPEYILINSHKTNDYGALLFGNDYGLKITNFVIENYILQKEIGLDPNQAINTIILLEVKVFKRADL